MTSAGSPEIQNWIPMQYLGTTPYAAWQVSLVVALVMAVTGFVWLTWPTPPWDAVLWAGMALMVLFPIFFFPWSKTLFVAVDLTFRPPAPEDFEQPREPSPAERNRPS